MQELQERFKLIILSNKELQGEWEEVILEKIYYLQKYKESREDLIEIEFESERMKVIVLLMCMAVNKLNDKGIKPKSSESLEIIDEYVQLAKVIIGCNNEYPYNEASKQSINTQTRLTTNYDVFSELSIYRELLDKKRKNRIVVNYAKVNYALNCYLKSNIRHIYLDRLFIQWLADKEIINYIVDVGIRKTDWTPRGRIEREEDKIYELKDAASGYINLKFFLPLIIFGIFAVLASLSFDFIPNWFGMVIVALAIVWFLIREKNKKDSLRALGNLEKYTPITTMIRKMEYFYLDIREQSPLPVSSIKKGLKQLEDSGALMPVAMTSIIEDLEDRGTKWI